MRAAEQPRASRDVPCIRLPRGQTRSSSHVFEIQGVLSASACDRARDAVNEAFDAGRTTDRGVSLPTQDVMVSSLPQRCQDEIKVALELAAGRVSRELPGVTLEFAMSRAFVIVYDAKRQKGLKKHTDGRKEGATLLLLISKPQRDFVGGGTRFFPGGILESSFDAKPGLGSTIVFPSDTLQHEGLPIKRGRRLLVCVFATKKQISATEEAAPEADAIEDKPAPILDSPAPDISHLRGKACDDRALAQECACVIS
ncbi:hypothetical protein CTAYLR_005923 [Chrysophaeum taylorii]|uniref:Fe2OG dioxygenase domain-containing protein n=1 Tax=Chrysophaeum taylorii TaxID=2483200 RepID=A0AAD7XHB3_9STRA|nr:hypothetical protein CTAYLR_005923 [Chrysophaeum taylorii]